MIAQLRYFVARGVKRIALGASGILLMIIGAGFLTTAGWIVLEEMFDAKTAALIIGGGFVGAGVLVIGFAKHAQKREMRTAAMAASATAQTELPLAALVAAFMQGIGAGSAARRGFSSAREKD